MSDHEPVYSDAAAYQRERAASWDDHERAWAIERQDARTYTDQDITDEWQRFQAAREENE